jgi:hypothetical protein
MSEKIHFQRFIRQHPLQLGDLPTQDQLSGSRIGKVYFFESIAPVVKQSSRYPKLSRKPEYVVAGLHSLESLASKFTTVSLPFLSLHFAAPFSQSVHHKLSHSRCSLQTTPHTAGRMTDPQKLQILYAALRFLSVNMFT